MSQDTIAVYPVTLSLLVYLSPFEFEPGLKSGVSGSKRMDSQLGNVASFAGVMGSDAGFGIDAQSSLNLTQSLLGLTASFYSSLRPLGQIPRAVAVQKPKCLPESSAKVAVV